MFTAACDQAKSLQPPRLAQLLLFTIVAFVILFFGNFAHAANVSEARIGIQNNTTLRLVLESDARLRPKVAYLANPDRIVIDMPGVVLNLGQGMDKGTRFIESYRYGAFSPDVARLVIDLTSPAVVRKKFALDPTRSEKKHRYAFDIKLTNRSKFTSAVSKTASALAQSAPPRAVISSPNGNALPVVVIDAGHGGNDPGTIGVSGKVEKHISLAVARKLYNNLKQSGRYKPVMTRDRDVYVALRDRVNIGRLNKADLFVSLHADSNPDKRLKGGTVYTLSEKASDKEAAALAAKENKSDIIAGIDLGEEREEVVDILITLAQRETKNFSTKFANYLIAEMGGQRLIPRRPLRSAGFVVLKAPDVPSLLVEMGYLSNKTDSNRLVSSTGQNEIVVALRRAIDVYFAEMERLGLTKQAARE